jgi:seryl-tRNA synthetase
MIDDGDGWLQDIATKNSLTFTRKSVADAADSKKDQRNQAREKYKGQIKKLKDRLAEAEKKGNESQIKSFKDQIARLKAQAEKVGVKEEEVESSPAGGEASATGVAAASNVDFTEIINEAYLRTLSRYPTEEEVRTSQAYISESSDAVDGVRGVMWALLNTREFMVNH